MERAVKIEPVGYSVKIILLFLLMLVTSVTCLSIGSSALSFGEIISTLFGSSESSINQQIILDIRLPRILLGIAVGGGLSVAGAVFQAILMNPLAEPYILGISSGGAFGAVLAILLSIGFIGLQVFSFSGALLVVFLVFMLGKRYGTIEPNTLLLSGVMVGAFFSAFILLLMTFVDSSFRTAIFWLIGNLSLADSSTVPYVLITSIIISFFLTIHSNKLNLLALGSEAAHHLGIDSERVKVLSYVGASLLVGTVVSVSGIIGFVGLLIPHVCRMIFGIDNRVVVPASFFIGGSFLVLADTVARNVIQPSELPVGAVTALIGAPVFIYLLRNRFNFS